jgi:hypothetical protein
MGRGGHLPLQISYFALEGSVLPGILFFKLIKLCAKSAVPHQKNESRNRGRDQDDRDQQK